jgi:hypothetical protein
MMHCHWRKTMEWLSQNWGWLAFAVAMLFMMRRGGAGGCCGGHATDAKRPEAEGAQTKTASSGGCCGGGGHGAEDKLPAAADLKTGSASAGGCCGGHGHDDKRPEAEGSQNAPAGAVHQP